MPNMMNNWLLSMPVWWQWIFWIWVLLGVVRLLLETIEFLVKKRGSNEVST